MLTPLRAAAQGPQQIRVQTILPGAVGTPLHRDVPTTWVAVDGFTELTTPKRAASQDERAASD